MRRALILASTLTAAGLLATTVQAQSAAGPGRAAGLRYLSWPGKAAQPAPRAAAPARTLRMPRAAAPVIPHAGAPAPAPVATAVPTPAAPAWTPPPAAEPAPTPDRAVDPMAPRRDAPIFRIQGASPQPAHTAAGQPQAPAPQAAQAAAPSAGGARYYSVHRQNGRQPDAMPTPQPVYLDQMPVELIQPPASADLAQPQGPPTLMRNADGRIQAVPGGAEPDLP